MTFAQRTGGERASGTLASMTRVTEERFSTDAYARTCEAVVGAVTEEGSSST